MNPSFGASIFMVFQSSVVFTLQDIRKENVLKQNSFPATNTIHSSSHSNLRASKLPIKPIFVSPEKSKFFPQNYAISG